MILVSWPLTTFFNYTVQCPKHKLHKRGDPFHTRSGTSQEPMGWGSDPMSAEMGVVCSWVSLERGVSAGMGVGSGIARERDVCGNGVSARDSGTGHQRGSLKKSSVSRRIQPFKVDEWRLTQLAG